mgnify:CR=1 FL=1
MTLTGFNITRLPSINDAIERVIEQLYAEIPLPSHPITEKHLSKSERNAEICERYWGGETLDEIAEDYQLSHQRVHEIILRWCD